MTSRTKGTVRQYGRLS